MYIVSRTTPLACSLTSGSVQAEVISIITQKSKYTTKDE